MQKPLHTSVSGKWIVISYGWQLIHLNPLLQKKALWFSTSVNTHWRADYCFNFKNNWIYLLFISQQKCVSMSVEKQAHKNIRSSDINPLIISLERRHDSFFEIWFSRHNNKKEKVALKRRLFVYIWGYKLDSFIVCFVDCTPSRKMWQILDSDLIGFHLMFVHQGRRMCLRYLIAWRWRIDVRSPKPGVKNQTSLSAESSSVSEQLSFSKEFTLNAS